MHLTAQWKEFSQYTFQALDLELITTYFFVIFRCACYRLCWADQNMFVSGKICHRWASLFLYSLKLFLQEEAEFSWYQQVQPSAYDGVTRLPCRSQKKPEIHRNTGTYSEPRLLWARCSTCGDTSWRVKGHQRISICPLSCPPCTAMMENSYNHETEL